MISYKKGFFVLFHHRATSMFPFPFFFLSHASGNICVCVQQDMIRVARPNKKEEGEGFGL